MYQDRFEEHEGVHVLCICLEGTHRGECQEFGQESILVARSGERPESSYLLTVGRERRAGECRGPAQGGVGQQRQQDR
jgi:hypothetical protein